MINTKKFDELFSEKEEYSFIKTKEEIETYVCKDNEQNIISLILDFKDFDLYKNSKNIQKVIIYFAIYNNRTKEYLDYTICGTRDFTEQIIISKNHSFLQLLNKFINYNTDISFKFLIVPIINENKKYVFSLEKYFFKPEKLSDNEEIIKIVKNTFSLVLTKLLPLLILVLIPANIYNYLISNLGFIDSLLDISLISRTFVYLLNLLVNNIFTYIICFIIITIISMPICGILTGYINFSFISFMSNIFRKMRTLFCQKNEHEYEILLEKINYKRAIKDTIQLLNILKSLKYYILSSTVSLSFILIYTVFFLFSQIIIANKKDNQQDTFISISAYQYMK